MKGAERTKWEGGGEEESCDDVDLKHKSSSVTEMLLAHRQKLDKQPKWDGKGGYSVKWEKKIFVIGGVCNSPDK